MKIEEELIPEMTLEDFANKHDLVMRIKERRAEAISMPHVGEGGRYYAQFKNCELGENGMLRGAFGNGATKKEAMRRYGREISEKRLIIKPTIQSGKKFKCRE